MSEDERDSLEEIRLMLQRLELGQEQMARSIEAQEKAREKDLQRLEERMSLLVTRREFEPIRTIAYGAAGLILLAFLTAVAALVIQVP